MKTFTIYTKIGCPYCTKVASVLQLAELQYVEYKLGRDFTGEEFYDEFGKGSTFPRVKYGEELLVDAKKLSSILKNKT